MVVLIRLGTGFAVELAERIFTMSITSENGDAMVPIANDCDLIAADGGLAEVVQLSPEELARRVKLAFKRIPCEAALVVFARVMTADLPHALKVAVWDAVRYSHIWWRVDDVLHGDVMENPIIRAAFADAVPMRRHVVVNLLPGWQKIRLSLSDVVLDGDEMELELSLPERIARVVCIETDEFASQFVMKCGSSSATAEECRKFADVNGNNLLWYLTYRDDQRARGGFACPLTERALLAIGVDPFHCNNLGLCWNDVSRHVNRKGEIALS